MGKKLSLILFVLACILLIYHCTSANGRKYECNIDCAGYQMFFSEIEHDTKLHFLLKPNESNDSIEFLLSYQQGIMDEIISFVFVEGVDSLFIRRRQDLWDGYSPEDREKFNIPRHMYDTSVPIIGELPKRCRCISFSDTAFFSFSDSLSNYIPRKGIHVIKLYHYYERGDLFELTESSFFSRNTPRYKNILLKEIK